MRRTVFILLCVGALSGCTTLSDFEAMTPEQRAIRVCANAESMQKLLQSCDGYEKAVKEHEVNLERGFVQYDKCVWYEIPDGEERGCWQGANGYVHCETRPKLREEQRCGPVTQFLDKGEEKVNLQNAKTALETCRQQIAVLKMSCMNKAANLSPEEAFRLFSDNQRP